MGDLKVSETFQAAVVITDNVTGVPTDGLAPTCNMVRVSNGAVTALTVQGIGGGTGAYRVTDFTNGAAGAWLTIWAVAGAYTINYPFQLWKAGGGRTEDIYDDTKYIYSTAIGGAPAANSIAARIDAAISTRLAAAAYTAERGTDNAALAATALSTATWTALRAGYLDELDFDLTARLGAPAGASISADILTANTAITAVNTDLGNYSGQANLQSLLAALGIPDVAAKSLYTCLITDRLDHGTYGLSAIETLVDDLESRLTAARAGYIDRIANHQTTYTFPSDVQPSVTVTAAAPNLALPSVVLPNWTGTITHVLAAFSFRMVENTNAGANKIDTIQYIQVQKAAGALTNCIKIPDDVFGVAATTREGGTPVFGNIDVVATVDAFNATYNFQWTAADADVANLVFNDVQTFLIVSYY